MPSVLLKIPTPGDLSTAVLDRAIAWTMSRNAGSGQVARSQARSSQMTGLSGFRFRKRRGVWLLPFRVPTPSQPPIGQSLALFMTQMAESGDAASPQRSLANPEMSGSIVDEFLPKLDGRREVGVPCRGERITSPAQGCQSRPRQDRLDSAAEARSRSPDRTIDHWLPSRLRRGRRWQDQEGPRPSPGSISKSVVVRPPGGHRARRPLDGRSPGEHESPWLVGSVVA